MKQLILLRHGQSVWNLENRFTGWTDVALSDRGREEARAAGLKMAGEGIEPRCCFTSYLRRAIHTLDIALDAMNLCWLPVVKDWHLNERHYGALQGLDKAATAAEYGAGQVHVWRRSYDVRPPGLAADDARWPGNDRAYRGVGASAMPFTESLADTVARVRPCWEELIAPGLQLRGTVLVVAHGNSLRALAMMLLGLSPDEIVGVEIPTGLPWVFSLDDALRVESERYL